MPSDTSVAPPDGLQPIDLSLSRNRNVNRSANHEADEPLNLCVSHQRRHVGCSRSQRRKRRRLERMVNHLHKCSSNSAQTTTSATPSSGDDEERDDDDEDEDEEEKVETASVRNPLLARTLGLLAVPTWPSGGAAAAYLPRSFYSSGSQQESTSTAPLPVAVGVAQAQKLSSSSCSPSSSPSPPLLSQCQSGPSMALMAAGRKRTQRALTGKHVKQGTGASPATLLTLRHKIEQRQRGQLCHRAINFHDSAISRSITAKKNGSNQATTRKKKSI